VQDRRDHPRRPDLSGGNDPRQCRLTRVEAELRTQQVHNAGSAVIAAAGNDGDNQPHYPAAQSQTISVAALNQTGTALTTFSDWGSWVDVAAPGQAVVGPMPGGSYASWAGTSMATPFVSGQAALLEAEVPGLSADKVSECIDQSAVKLAGNPVQFGAINIPASLKYALTHH